MFYKRMNANTGVKFTIDPTKETDYIISYLKEQFAIYGSKTKAVIGMSGGKDSTIACALLCEAIGSDRVVAVIMPDGESEKALADRNLAIAICHKLDINSTCVVDINKITQSFYFAYEGWDDLNHAIKTNTPARIRMAMLYAIASSCHGRVVNTCNASEEYVGWSTKWGDNTGDFTIFGEYPVRYVKMIGYELVKRGILEMEWVDRIPDDGMCGLTDEDKFGFTYNELDDYIINGIIPSIDKLTKIKEMHKRAKHKANIRFDGPRPLTEHEEDKVWVPEIDPWL